MAHRLVLEDVTIAREARQLVALSASIAAGEILTVVGPSGSGKSSLLAYIAGFLDRGFTAQGRVLIDGADIARLPPEKRQVGLLFQDALLFPHLSVGGNLLFAVPRHSAERRTRMRAALADVGLQGFEDRDPASLSGGEKARVALQRVLLSKPRAVLLDEPFSRLDAALRGEVRRLVFSRLAQAGLPALLVTHDSADAEAAGGRIFDLGRQDKTR
jgi:putative thiamine transport system ATP-binding protein